MTYRKNRLWLPPNDISPYKGVWTSGVQYQHGDMVKYSGNLFVVIDDLPPPTVAPATGTTLNTGWDVLTTSLGSSGGNVTNVDTLTTLGLQTYTIPSGVTSIQIECWAGGAGGGSTTGADGGGGGGGAYSRVAHQAVVAGDQWQAVVGSGGAVNTDGGDSTFTAPASAGGAVACAARGGKHGTGGSAGTAGIGGAGGSAGSGVGDIGAKFSGGAGANGTTASSGAGGGGGGGAGTSNSGGDAPAASTANAGTGGATGGGNGGKGGGGLAGTTPGTPGSQYGGAGGGAGGVGQAATIGAQGKIVITGFA